MELSKLKSLIRHHFLPESYLSFQLVLGLLVLLLAAGAFAFLAEDVTTNDPIVQFDTAIVNAIHINSSPTLVQMMEIISFAGSQVPTAVTIILALYFVWRRCWNDLLLFVLAVGGAQIANLLLKILFQRLRPSFTDPTASAIGFSFPSGHAMGAMAFYGLIAYLLMRNTTALIERALIFIIFAIIVGLVGFSRIYLGVHYPSDVLGGYIAGLAWLALTITGVETYRSRRDERNRGSTE